MDSKLEQLARQVGDLLLNKQLKLTTAESCTGGWIAQIVTSVAGSSQWFERGFVTYSNQAKQEMLNVAKQTLVQHGAVSEQVVIQMAQGALQHSHADISIAVTGIAGPDGGTDEKPVGTVWLAWADKQGKLQTHCQCFSGDRSSIRQQAVELALEEIISLISV